jgi:hypothetical protein
MEFPVNFVLEIKSEEELKVFQTILDATLELSDDSIEPAALYLRTEERKTFEELKGRIEFRKTNPADGYRVRINAKEISKGTLEEMRNRYDTECGMHSRSNVYLEEWVNGDWRPKATRKIQKVS